jgi:hypothetical protein
VYILKNPLIKLNRLLERRGEERRGEEYVERGAAIVGIASIY